MKINDNKIVDGLMPDGSYQDRVDVQGQERAGTGITANTFNQIIREFQDNYIAKAGIIPLSDDLGQLYKATQYFINQSLLPAVASLEQKLIDTRALRIGEIAPWAGTLDTIPYNAYLCDDALCLIEDHQLCFKAIRHSWANGRIPPDGYFYLPHGNGAVLKGIGQSTADKFPPYKGKPLTENRIITKRYQATASERIYAVWDAGNGNVFSTSGAADRIMRNNAWVGSLEGGYGVAVLDSSLTNPTGETNRDNNLAVYWIIFYKA